ncbi:MAG: RloB family protein [Methanosarcinaceae archaeon]|nr:RloB family protein [Methanosarcinaceae archaeon]
MTKEHPRKTGTRARHKLLVIVCEGEKTEPIYFNRYKEGRPGLSIEIPNTSDTDPKKLVKFAIRQIENYDLDLKNGDDIWCVFDCDNNPNTHILSACKNAGKRVKICLSNPSFELWYLLHFAYIESPLTNPVLMEQLKRKINGYKKNEDYFDLLKSNRETAINNAKKIHKMHKSNGIDLFSTESNPSTHVYKIVEEILKY